MDSRWVTVDFDSCPECGNQPEIYTDSAMTDYFYDGDDVRCTICRWPGMFICDGLNDGWISWWDEDEDE